MIKPWHASQQASNNKHTIKVKRRWLDGASDHQYLLRAVNRGGTKVPFHCSEQSQVERKVVCKSISATPKMLSLEKNKKRPLFVVTVQERSKVQHKKAAKQPPQQREVGIAKQANDSIDTRAYRCVDVSPPERGPSASSPSAVVYSAVEPAATWCMTSSCSSCTVLRGANRT